MLDDQLPAPGSASYRGRPFHARDVVVARIARDGDPLGRATSSADDADARGGVGLPRLGILDLDDVGVQRVGGVVQRKVLHAGGIELPVGYRLAVRAPAPAVLESAFLFVEPSEASLHRL